MSLPDPCRVVYTIILAVDIYGGYTVLVRVAISCTARAMAIPGILEAGWTMSDLIAATGQGKEADRQKSALKSELLSMIRKIEE